jgi:alanyl-tRNA synthetase
VTGQVDWARRFDLMQHHTGQHILTQAFVQVAELHTVSFHLSADSVTIDLDTPSLAQSVIDQAETVANQVIYGNRPVTARLIDPNDTSGVRMRRLPPHMLTPGLRVIDVEDFDLTACGGTHVRQTGEIGMIKLIRAEKRTEKTRVEFRCGWRALSDYRAKNALAGQLTTQLSCGMDEISTSIERLQEDYKQTLRALKAANASLMEYEAVRLRDEATEIGGAKVVRAVFTDRDAGDLRALANLLVAQPGTLALLGVAGEKAQVIVARSADLSTDVRTLLERAKAVIPTLRGGGQPSFAQGGANADAAQVEAALAAAEQSLSE